MIKKILIGILIIVGVTMILILISQEEKPDEEWINTKINDSKPTEYKNMNFGVHIGDLGLIEECCYADTLNFTLATLKATKETGSNVAKMYIFYDPWILDYSESIARIDKIVNEVKSQGMDLMIADQGAKHFKNNPLNWEEYKKSWAEHAEILIKRYNPDYYFPVVEPSTNLKENELEESKISVDNYIDQTQIILNKIKQLSPNTKTGIAVFAGHTYEEEYYRKALELENLDVIGINIYPSPTAEDAFSYAKNLIAKHPHDYGKEMWVIETWNGIYSSYDQFNTPGKDQEDADWITATVYFAQNNDFDGYVIYYGGHLMTYITGWKGEYIDYSNRTPAFYALKEIIEEVNREK